jgi:hypothetical protein
MSSVGFSNRGLQRPLWPAALGAVWVVSVCAGSAVLLGYENRPGLAADPPAQWPVESRLERAAGRATLVMLLHPGCPCSRASIEELDRLMAASRGRATVHVLFFKPRGFPDGWEKTDLWHRAAAIPGVRVTRDDDAVEAGLFRAATSGQVVVYDARGALVFSGGITPSRGHSGDSDGRRAILAALTAGDASSGTRTRVYGCSLREPEANAGTSRADHAS